MRRIRITHFSGIGQLVGFAVLFGIVIGGFGLYRCVKTEHQTSVKNLSGELLTAIRSGDQEAVGEILDQGADPNVVFSRGETTLHHAVRTARRQEEAGVRIIETLLARGADVSVKDGNGMSPLTKATLSGPAAAIPPLIKGGADPNSPLPTGVSLLATARLLGKHDSVVALEEGGAVLGTSQTEKALVERLPQMADFMQAVKQRAQQRSRQDKPVTAEQQ